MPFDRIPLGVFTTDRQLVIRTWDDWLARATGISAAHAINKPVADVIADLDERGILAAFQNVLTNGTIEILAPALHRFLIPCRPTYASTTFRQMQQHVTIGPVRVGGKITGAVVTVEDVTARMESERWLAVRYERERRQRALAGHRESPETIASFSRMLGQADRHARGNAVAALARQGHGIIDGLIGTLRRQHADFTVLSSILDLLAISDIDIIEPLAICLDDRDANLRIQSALMLGQRNDHRAVDPLIKHLSDPDVNVRYHIIEALGRLRAPEASELLADVAEERDFFLSFPAIQALTQIGNPSVAPRLVRLLADEWLRAAVIDALGELGDDDVVPPLVQLLNSADAPTDVITDALAGLHDRYERRYGAGDHIANLVRRSINAIGTQNILDAVERVSADRLPGMAKVMGWLGSEAAQRALTRLLGRDLIRAQVVEALVRYGAGVVTLLIEQLHAEDLETRQAAAVALGRIGDRRATPALVEALAERELAVVAAGALARIGDSAAFDPLMSLLGDQDSAIRQAAIAALNSIGHADMPHRIVTLLADADPIVRESAVRIAGYFGYESCLARVLDRCHDEHEPVRRTAVEQLAQFDGPEAFEMLTQAIHDESPRVRAAACAALVRSEHPARVEVLRDALIDADPWVRYVAVRSLGVIGDTSVVPAILTALERDTAPHVRLAAIEVVGRLQPDDALQILEPLAQASDHDVARAAIAALGHVDRPDALRVLESLLRAPEPLRRHAAIDALAVRHDTRVPHMLQWVAAADEQPNIVEAAVDALARVGVREDQQAGEATRALIALTAEPTRRERAISALSNLPARRIPDIAGGLRHPATDVRRASVQVLSRMKQPDASRELEFALLDVSPSVRLTAVSEIKRLGTRGSQGTLMRLARTDPDRDVRQAAMLAVARMDGAPGEFEPRTSAGS